MNNSFENFKQPDSIRQMVESLLNSPLGEKEGAFRPAEGLAIAAVALNSGFFSDEDKAYNFIEELRNI